MIFSEESDFWKVFSNAIDDYMNKRAEVKTYSIGYTVIEPRDSRNFQEALNAFFKAMQKVLRKEDTYTFFEPNVVVFVLNDVPETFLPLIKERIEKIFYEIFRKEISLN